MRNAYWNDYYYYYGYCYTYCYSYCYCCIYSVKFAKNAFLKFFGQTWLPIFVWKLNCFDFWMSSFQKTILTLNVVLYWVFFHKESSAISIWQKTTFSNNIIFWKDYIQNNTFFLKQIWLFYYHFCYPKVSMHRYIW